MNASQVTWLPWHIYKSWIGRYWHVPLGKVLEENYHTLFSQWCYNLQYLEFDVLLMLSFKTTYIVSS